ncbi:hypothetical protein [Streptomyces virginiae]|uniref:hypothetical protein n=1 Tax=Streptomyces virginiae TaxID=1961 RepID=UPI003687C34C
MTTTDDIARTHGHNGPTNCQDCGSPITQYVLNPHIDQYSELAYSRVYARAVESYGRGAYDAAEYLGLTGAAVHEHALSALLESVGRAYAAAAINKVAESLVDKLDEDTYVALSDIAATLDLDVVEDLDGANGTGEDDLKERVFYREDGWIMGSSDAPEPCTSNHHRAQAGLSPCTDMAVWKVVEFHGLAASIGFYCDGDLPSEQRHLANRA